MPRALPAVPLGFTQRVVSRAEGITTSAVVAPDGRELPVVWTHKPATRHDHEYRGYQIRGSGVVLKTWGELVRVWPKYAAAIEKMTSRGMTEAQAIDSFGPRDAEEWT